MIFVEIGLRRQRVDVPGDGQVRSTKAVSRTLALGAEKQTLASADADCLLLFRGGKACLAKAIPICLGLIPEAKAQGEPTTCATS